jgi:formylglycine-generating enzyme required for sulfatase activity
VIPKAAQPGKRRGFLLFLGFLILAAGGALTAGWFLHGESPRESAPFRTPGGCGGCRSELVGDERLPDPTDGVVKDAGSVEATEVRDVPPPGAAPEGMVWVPPGKFSMGSDYQPFGDARPIHTVELDGFWMDRAPVTNEQFAAFVHATGYVTVAERKPDPKDFPGVPAEKLVPGSLVFTPPRKPVSLADHRQWWRFVPGACWNHPEGPSSNLKGREKHPVVHVCWGDAAAYAKWAGKRLPTEAEWEYAARGKLMQMPYVWGREFRPDGRWMANTWQGRFPSENTKDDGWERTSPVGSFPANGFGLYDMAGNVWQWCNDWYRPDYYAQSPRRNPRGPTDFFDPNEPGVPKRVQRGGSFLCSDQYCARYMPGGRGKGAVDTGSSHVGFRCVQTPR